MTIRLLQYCMLLYKALSDYNPIIASYVMYARAVQKDCPVLRTGTASAQISHSDRSMQGESSIFLGLFDLPCQGREHISLFLSVISLRLAMRTGMFASDVSHLYSSPSTNCSTHHSPAYLYAVERIPMRGMSSHRQSKQSRSAPQRPP